MKILLINGSPNETGTTFTALSEMKKTFQQEGIDSEIINIGNKAIKGCIACGSCGKTGKCAIDDIVNEVAEKFITAEGLVVGSPVYYASANGTLISFLDRLFMSCKADKRFKVGASIVCARRGGLSSTFDELNKYFLMNQMPVAASNYWNSLHGPNAETAEKDKEGLQTMRILAKNIAFMIKSFALAKEKFGLPEPEEKIKTGFLN